jgi:hypothetical protein
MRKSLQLHSGIKTQVMVWMLISTVVFGSFLAIPITDDYKNYMGGTRLWLVGETKLYDGSQTEFYYLPWSLWITAPLSWLPDRIGQAALNFASFWMILLSLRILNQKIPWWGVFMVLANLFTINLFFTAQWDALILGAVAVAWWAVRSNKPVLLGFALILMATKPTNIILPAFLILVSLFKERSLRDLLITSGVVLLGFIWSFWACGLIWPVRYLAYVREFPPPNLYNISIWRLIDWFEMSPAVLVLFFALVVGWMVWVVLRFKITSMTLSMALVVNLLISPYVVSYHYISVAPLFVWIGQRKFAWAIGVYTIMFILFLHVADLIPMPPIYFLYPLSIWIAWVVQIFLSDRSAAENPSV